MSDKMTPEGRYGEFNHTFTIDMSDPAIQRWNLARTATSLPVDYLKNWLQDFIDMEKFEEADIIKKELEARK